MSELLTRIQADIEKDPYYKDNFANDGERFLAWYLRNIYQRTAVEARQDITDGQNDKEIDAVIVDDEKRKVFIFQGKFFTDASVTAVRFRKFSLPGCGYRTFTLFRRRRMKNCVRNLKL